MHVVIELFGRRFEMASAYHKVEEEEPEIEDGEEEPEHLTPDPHSVPHASMERAYPPFEHAGVNELPGRLPFGFCSAVAE